MSLSAGKAVAAVLALGAGSVLGYNWITTGCPSGVCPTDRAASSAVVPVADTAETKSDSCCPLTAETTAVAAELPGCCAELGEAACGDASKCADMGSDMAAGCDAEEQTETVVQTVTNEAAGDSCCPSEKTAEPVTETAAKP